MEDDILIRDEEIFSEANQDRLISLAEFSNSFKFETDEEPKCLAFNNDGTRVFFGIHKTFPGFSVTTTRIKSFDLVKPYELIATDEEPFVFGVSTTFNNIVGLAFNDDGSKMFIAGPIGSQFFMYTYDLYIAFNIRTAVFNGETKQFQTQQFSFSSFIYNNDGSKMFVTDGFTKNIYTYALSTPYDITTMGIIGIDSLPVSGLDSLVGICFNNDGSKMYLGLHFNTIYAFELALPFVVSSVIYNTDEFLDISSNGGIILGILVNNNNDNLFVVDGQTDTALSFNLDVYVSSGTVLNLIYDNGDLAIGNAREQNITNILGANKGNFRRNPILGADLHNLLDGPSNALTVENRIYNALLVDNYILEEMEVNGSDIKILKVRQK